ncbi:hypothetical protein LXA43DRAFT_1061632 [Ganoderma leucocontextum]|nr:hypothetical protein LXA43DRAFT_1061632 [Ganoderma leucocontextum]
MSSNSTPTSPGQTGAFSLVIPPTTYCAGSDVEGEVVLDFPKAQHEHIDEVIVELRGTMKVSALHPGQRIASTERRDLVSLKQSLWKRGSAYPPPDSHVLRLPFRFRLPSGPEILPSVSWDEWRDHVTISYCAEAIALRPTTFFANDKRIRKSLAVVSRGDPTLCASIRSLTAAKLGGGPTWKTVHKEKQMRRGIWGEYSTARVELLVPNKHGILPHCVDIPVLMKVKTTTARLSRAKADKHPEGKPIFPAVEIDSNNPIHVNLRQKFTVRAGGDTKDSTTEIVLAYIKPRDLPPSSYHKQWEDDTGPGDKEEMGKWVQQWTLQPTIKLHRFPPTFSCDFVDCAYTIWVEVQFPGAGNDIKVKMPITLDSGIEQAVPQKTGPRAARQLQTATALNDAPLGGGTDVPRDEEPPSLPPTYFDAVYRDVGVLDESIGARDVIIPPLASPTNS